jgi:dihydroneopterin aldolase
MDTIRIVDLEVCFHVGVPDSERAQPQRLLISLDLHRDFREAALADDLSRTIDYYAVSRRILGLGKGRSWRLIERLAEDIAALVLAEFGPDEVRVEVKKFILPETRHVSVEVRRSKHTTIAAEPK